MVFCNLSLSQKYVTGAILILNLCEFQASSPACTELETIVMDWLGMMIGLPDGFLHRNVNTPGNHFIVTLEPTNNPILHCCYD